METNHKTNGSPLASDDLQVLWQGRPAPRCYTFRKWKQALAGSVLFMLSNFWLMVALDLVQKDYPFWLIFLPVPLILGSFILGPLQIIVARSRWPHIFYRLTASHLLVEEESIALSDICELKVRKQGAKLASLRLATSMEKVIILHCIEEPETLMTLLRKHCPQLKV